MNTFLYSLFVIASRLMTYRHVQLATYDNEFRLHPTNITILKNNTNTHESYTWQPQTIYERNAFMAMIHAQFRHQRL